MMVSHTPKITPPSTVKAAISPKMMNPKAKSDPICAATWVASRRSFVMAHRMLRSTRPPSSGNAGRLLNAASMKLMTNK